MVSTITGVSKARASFAVALLVAGGLLLGQLVGAGDAAAKSVTYTHKSFKLSGANQKRRLTVRCPGHLVPLGGGMTSSPGPSGDGEGIYPHSYERLGVQHGYHSTVVLFDPSPGSTTQRQVTLQAACARKQKHVTPPHTTTFVAPGQTKTVVATCPGRRSKKPLLTEVSGTTTVAAGQYATTTTPSCPRGHIVFGGFSSSPAGSVFLTNGTFTGSGGWSASAWNHFGPTADITA